VSKTRDEVTAATVPDDCIPSIARERLPTIDGLAGAAEFCERLGVPMTASGLRRDVNSGALASFLVQNRLRFAPHDIYQFLASKRRTSVGKPRGRAVAS
jgi:hypothetical protein